MALVRTTLTSAYTAGDKSIVVSSAAGFAAGYSVQIDQEMFLIASNYSSGTTVPVICGQAGTVNAAHASGASVVAGIASDWSTPAPQVAVQYPIAGRARTLTSYSAAGAITLPTPGADAVAVINGTNALAMTLAVPTKDMDGCRLDIVSNGKAAHTVAPAAAFNDAGSTFDTLATFAAGGLQVLALIAINEKWCIYPSVAGGTLTNVTITFS